MLIGLARKEPGNEHHPLIGDKEIAMMMNVLCRVDPKYEKEYEETLPFNITNDVSNKYIKWKFKGEDQGLESMMARYQSQRAMPEMPHLPLQHN